MKKGFLIIPIMLGALFFSGCNETSKENVAVDSSSSSLTNKITEKKVATLDNSNAVNFPKLSKSSLSPTDTIKK